MVRPTRARLLRGTLLALIVSAAILATAGTGRQLSAATAAPCYCSANCLFTDCRCIGTKSCQCECFLFAAFCNCELT